MGRRGILGVDDADQAFELLYGLVVRDTQIRVLLGEVPPSPRQVRARAVVAVDQLWTLLEVGQRHDDDRGD